MDSRTPTGHQAYNALEAYERATRAALLAREGTQVPPLARLGPTGLFTPRQFEMFSGLPQWRPPDCGRRAQEKEGLLT